MHQPQSEEAEFPQVKAASLDLIYKIEGRPIDVDIFELSQVLEGFGNVLKESYRVTQGRGSEINVRVKPFERGSFVVDFTLWVQQHAGFLFPLTHTEIVQAAKDTLATLGFIKDATKESVSLIELLRHLKEGKPEKIEQKGPDKYDFRASDGSVVPVNSKVNRLYSNAVINKNTYNIVLPALKSEKVTDILTFLKNQPETQVRIDQEDAKRIQAYSRPELSGESEVYEGTNTRILNPKSGNYGQTKGTWQFYIAGQRGTIKAKISDAEFLLRYSNGEIRFHQGDRLKVRLFEKQIVEGPKTKMEYEIIEVLEYMPWQPAQKAG